MRPPAGPAPSPVPGEAAGTYQIFQNTLGIEDNGAFLAGNYTLVFVNGTLTITDQGTVTPAIPAPLVETDDDTTLTIPEPITQITLKAKKATADDDGVLAFEDDETEMGDRGLLPANLTATQSSLTMESDITTQDDTGGILGRGRSDGILQLAGFRRPVSFGRRALFYPDREVPG